MRGIRSIGGIVLFLALVGGRLWLRSNGREKAPLPEGSDIVHFEADAEIEAASARARAKLLKDVAPLWAAGRPEGEALHVMSPFLMKEGEKEFIWLEVESWTGNDIKGKLINQPESVPGLHLGSEVIVQADQVFDYVRTLKDGTEEGNETQDLILKKSMKK
jgi:uncharacterized protein YegJ (DUF2314 family)